MEACTAVEKELDKVFEKFRDLDKENQKKVEDIIHKIDEYVASLNDSKYSTISRKSFVTG